MNSFASVPAFMEKNCVIFPTDFENGTSITILAGGYVFLPTYINVEGEWFHNYMKDLNSFISRWFSTRDVTISGIDEIKHL